MGNQLTVPSGSSWYLDDFNSNHLKNPESIFDGTFNLSFRAEEKQEPVAVKAIQLSGKDGRSIAQTFFNIYDDKSKIISRKSGNLISTPILTKNAAYLKRPFIDMPITERIVIDPPLEFFEKKWIAFQLLYAIRNLHNITIFHGDIKPENILVDPDLNVYLTDHAPFKPQYISQNQPHYFIHFFSYGRPSAYIAPERLSLDLSTNPELQKEQTNRAILAIQAITESLQHEVFYQPHSDNFHNSNSNDNISGQAATESKSADTTSEKVPQTTINNKEALEALHFMQAADLFSIGCVLAFIFTGGKSLFDFTSLVQYGLSNDDTPLKILDQIKDDKIQKLIMKLIDRDQKKRIEAISHFEESFPSWMNDLYLFYVDKIVETPLSEFSSVNLDKVSQIFPCEIHDEILIYLNIIMDFFSKKMKISQLTFFIRHFEQFSLRVSSAKLKIVRLLPPLLFLLQRESSTISLIALDSVINIVRSIETIENEEDEIVKNFCDVFFIPQLVSVMDPKNKKSDNEKIVIISHIPAILAEFGRLWPSILEKLPMRTEFIIPMLQYGGNSPVDQTKLMIVRHFIASARSVAFTKSYPVFRALYRILFQMLNCPVYVPLIVEFVKQFLKELNHVDKIRFYSELFAPFQGAVLSYASTFTKSDTAEDILIIFDTFATMIQSGELRTTSFTAIANAAYKHITSFHPSSRVAARVLLKKLPKIYQQLDIITIVSPQPQQTLQNSQQSSQNLQPPIPIQKAQRSTVNPKMQQMQQQQQQLQMQQQQQSSQQSLSKSQKVTRKKGKKGQTNIDDGEFYETNEAVNDGPQPNNNSSSANGSNENLNMSQSTINNSVQSSQQPSTSNLNSSSETELNSSNINLSNQPSTSSTRQIQEGPKSTPTKHYQQQIKTQLFSSTKIGSSSIEKILIVHDDTEKTTQSIVLHSKSTVVCYSLNVNQTNTFKYNQSSFDNNKVIEQSWIYTYPKPIVNIDMYKVKNESGLIFTFSDTVIKRNKGRNEKILETKKAIKMCKMVNGTTMAFSDANFVVCRDLSHNFELKGSYRIEKDSYVNGIYSWDSMGDNFFCISSSNGRLHAIDQRSSCPIFTTCEYKGMSNVVLLPHFAYAVVREKKDMCLFRYSPLFESDDTSIVKNDLGGFAPRPTYQLMGPVDSMMSVSNSLLLLNQYGTFMLDNVGDCFSLGDKNRFVQLNPRSVQSHFLNRMHSTSSSFNQTEANQSAMTRHRSTTLYDVSRMSLSAVSAAKSELNLPSNKSVKKIPVVKLPFVNRTSLHGHTFQVTTCANYNNGAICMSGDSAGYLNVWSAIHPRSEFV